MTESKNEQPDDAPPLQDSLKSGNDSESDPVAAESDEVTAASETGSALTSETPAEPGPAEPGSIEGAEDELPEWEPLTPELAEEEAIRNDLAIRWGVVFIALLLGFMQIAETRSLVHIKSGEYQLANGLLPPSRDVFSYTIPSQPWTQLEWLFDLTVGAVHSIQGVALLVLFKALIAAAVFGVLLRVTLPGVPTWWGSVCAALALLTCYPQFTLEPQLITLLGLTLTLYWLFEWKADASAGFPWKLPLLFVVWSNLDDRMFLGPGLLVLYAIGSAAGRLRAGDGGVPPARQNQLWQVVGACFLATLINPFLWKSLAACVTLYGAEYPAMRLYHPLTAGTTLQYYSMLSPESWRAINPSTIAGGCVALAAVIAMFLNRAKLDVGQVSALAGFFVLGMVTNHEIAALSIVAAAFATLNGQEWYLRTCRQEYSIDVKERLFSLGGRAVTVAALFAFAFLGTSGHMAGGEGRRIGLGLDANLQTTLDELAVDLESVGAGDRIFNYNTSQGDMMVWLGRPVFIDGRLSLYATSRPNLVELHHRTRLATAPRTPDDDGADADAWKTTFATHEIRYAMPRVYGPALDARTFSQLLISGDWTLTHVGGAAALFYRTDTDEPEVDVPSLRIVERAFRTPVTTEAIRSDWAREPGVYQRYLFPPQSKRPAPLLRARNYLWLLERAGELGVRMADRTALAYLSIRNANEALVEEPQSFRAFRILGRAYRRLGELESAYAQSRGGLAPDRLRYYQSVCALNQSLKIEPNNLDALEGLFYVYTLRRRVDLALRTADRMVQIMSESDVRSEQLETVRKQLRDQMDKIAPQFESELERTETQDERVAARGRLQLARAAWNDGYVLEGLRLLESEGVAAREGPEYQHLQGMILLEVGRVEEAFEVLSHLKAVAEEYPGQTQVPWQFPVAVSNLAYGNYDTAQGVWAQRARTLDRSAGRAVFEAVHPRVAPLVASPYFLTPASWPFSQLAVLRTSLVALPAQVAANQFNAGIAYLEEGRTDEAGVLFESVLSRFGSDGLGPLAAFYVGQITGEDGNPPEPIDDWQDLDDLRWDSANASSGPNTPAATEPKPRSGQSQPAIDAAPE